MSSDWLVAPDELPWTGRHRHQAIHLREQLEMVAGLGVGRDIEQPVVVIHPRLHEDIERIMHIVRRQLELGDRGLEVGLAVRLAGAAGLGLARLRPLQRPNRRSWVPARSGPTRCSTVSLMMVSIGRIRGGVLHSHRRR